MSDISLYELAALDARGRIRLSEGFLRDLAAQLTVLPIEPDIAAAATRFSLPQGDPFDRRIVATVLHHELTLVTADAAITASGMVPPPVVRAAANAEPGGLEAALVSTGQALIQREGTYDEISSTDGTDAIAFRSHQARLTAIRIDRAGAIHESTLDLAPQTPPVVK